MTVSINPWSRGDKARVYVSDGSRRLGYFDPKAADEASRVVADQHSTDPEADVVAIRRILADAIGARTGFSVARHAWNDLATNAPGAAIAHKTGRGYEAGVIGEQRTAGVLSPLMNAGWRVLHGVPLGSAKDIDHLVIGPVGVVLVNSKATSYPVTVESDGKVIVDGYHQAWTDSMTRDAEMASRALSAALREQVQASSLVSVWTPHTITGSDQRVVAGSHLVEHLTSMPSILDRTWVEQIFATARRSDTWQMAGLA